MYQVNIFLSNEKIAIDKKPKKVLKEERFLKWLQTALILNRAEH